MWRVCSWIGLDGDFRCQQMALCQLASQSKYSSGSAILSVTYCLCISWSKWPSFEKCCAHPACMAPMLGFEWRFVEKATQGTRWCVFPLYTPDVCHLWDTDWLFCIRQQKKQGCLPSDWCHPVITSGIFFYIPSCTQSAHTIWSQADAAADLRQSPSELNFLPQAAKQNRKTTTKKCVLTYADGKEVNKKNKRGGRAARWKEARREGGWNLAHLLPWQGSQSCVMVWRLRDGHRAVV